MAQNSSNPQLVAGAYNAMQCAPAARCGKCGVSAVLGRSGHFLRRRRQVCWGTIRAPVSNLCANGGARRASGHPPPGHRQRLALNSNKRYMIRYKF